MRATDVRFKAAESHQIRDGLLGWASFVLGETVRLDGVAVRRTRDGRLVLSFPSRRDRRGREHYLVAPIDNAARLDIERQVLAALPGSIEEVRT